MGVNSWGVSPLYVNPVNVLSILTKILAEGKGIAARYCPKEARAQTYESRPDWRDCVGKVRVLIRGDLPNLAMICAV